MASCSSSPSTNTHTLGPKEAERCNMAIRNYGQDVKRRAKQFSLPPDYLMALIMLECSGNKPASSRYEKHVYARLKSVKSGGRKSYEGISKKDLESCSDDALKNLSRSWGPFQIMGYKSIHLGIKVKELRGTVGKGEIYWGCKWIRDTYGEYLDRGDYPSAFRLHNTGSPTGRTHDKNYVKNGIRYAEYFKVRM